MKKREGKKETVYFFGWNFVSKAITYLVLFVLANLFSVEVYGKASYALSIFNLSLLFILLGIPHTFVPWHVKKKDSSSVSYFSLLLSLVFVVVGFILFWKEKWIFPLIFVLPFFLIKGIGESFLRIKHKHHIVQIFGALSMILYLAFLVLFSKFNEFGITLSFAMAHLILAIFMVFFLRNDFFGLFSKVRIHFAAVKSYLSKAFFTGFITLSFAFLGWIDSFILGLLSNYENVANYTLSNSLAGIVMVVPISLSMFLLTRSAEINTKKKSGDVLRRVIRMAYSFSLIFSIVLISILGFILKYFFPNYMGVEFFVLVLLVGLLFFSVYHTIAIHYTGRLKPEKIFYPLGFAALLNIVLDVILIPHYGVYGIVFATAIAHLSAMVLLINKSKVWSYFLPTFILSGFVVWAYFLGLIGILLVVPAGIGLMLTKMITKGDRDIIFKVIKNIFSKN